jgi:hypothetical protein
MRWQSTQTPAIGALVATQHGFTRSGRAICGKKLIIPLKPVS